MTRSTSLVTRGVLAVFGVFYLGVGAWAVLAPHNWYDNFPGVDPRLIAAEPPYNAHLATDAGAGFLAVGVVAVLAAVWLTPLLGKVALAGYLVHATPHLVYHLAHPAPGLTDGENIQNAATLAVLVLAPLLALVMLFGWFSGRPRGAGRDAPEPPAATE